LRDSNLRLLSFIKGKWLQIILNNGLSTVFTLVIQFSKEVKIDEIIKDLRVLSVVVSQVKLEFIFDSLAILADSWLDWKLIVVQDLSHWVFDHAVQNWCTQKVNGILNNNQGVVDPVIKGKSHEAIFMIDVGFSPFEIDCLNKWLDITIVCGVQSSNKVDKQVLDVEVHHAICWEDPGIHMHVTTDVPVLDTWKLHFHT
jgi:hypothetical protein